MKWMRKHGRMLAGFVLGMLVAGSALSTDAAGSQPGSDSDPLVTKSYVDERFDELEALVGSGGSTGTGATGGSANSAVVDQLRTDVGDLTHFIIDALTEQESLKARLAAIESGFVVVEVPAGKTVTLSGGAELVLRSGKATTLAGTYGGLADITAGKDLLAGSEVPAQHMLLSSRSDGRGIKTRETTAYLLIRGGYAVN